MSLLSIFSFNCFIDVAPIILLVTKGLSLTKALAKVDGEIPASSASLTYEAIAFSPRTVWCLENLRGQIVYLDFSGFWSFKYFPLSLPPANGE